jgi:acid ceramidase
MLRPLLVNVNFTRGGKVVFQSTQYAGYVGVLTGMSDKFSVTIDDRFALNGGFAGIIDWFRGDRKQKWVSLLTRCVMTGWTFLVFVWFVCNPSWPKRG